MERVLQRHYEEFHTTGSTLSEIAMEWAIEAGNAKIVHELLEFYEGKGLKRHDWMSRLRHAVKWTIRTDKANSLKDIMKKYDASEIITDIYSRESYPKPELLAAKFGDMELLELLSPALKWGIWSHSKAIEVAYEKRHEDIIIFLFNHHASVRSDIFCKILKAAADESRISLQQFLLSRWNSLLRWWESEESDILRIIDYGIDINLQNSFGKTPLMRAASSGFAETARQLLDRKARIDIQDKNGVTALLQVVSEIESLGKQMAGVNYMTPGYFSKDQKMFRAQARILDSLLSHNADPNIADNKGSLPLHAAIRSQAIGLVEVLLKHRADVNIGRNSSSTALGLAVQEAPQPVVQILLDHRADIDIKDKDGLTPLWHACRAGRLDNLALLLNCGADIEARNGKNMTPLNWAAHNGHQRVFEVLLGHCPDVNTRGIHMLTPLMGAAHGGRARIVNLLLEHKAVVDLEDDKKMTAIFHAAHYNHEEVVRALLKNGATFDSADAYGKTPLDYATSRGCYEVIRLLEYTVKKSKQNV